MFIMHWRLRGSNAISSRSSAQRRCDTLAPSRSGTDMSDMLLKDEVSLELFAIMSDTRVNNQILKRNVLTIICSQQRRAPIG